MSIRDYFTAHAVPCCDPDIRSHMADLAWTIEHFIMALRRIWRRA